MWQGPGEVQLNATCLDEANLDFFVVSGNGDEMKRRGPPASLKVRPDCRHCNAFFLQSQLPTVDENVTILVASNKEGFSRVKLRFDESLISVPSCMDRCFGRPWAFVGLALFVAALLACGFHFSQPLCREVPPHASNVAWDAAWAPELAQCRRPLKPREAWRTWILHGCIMTYPWNPWHNDPLEYKFRCLVLTVSLGLTMCVSTLYGHMFSYWDSTVSTQPWERTSEDSGQQAPSVQGALLVSILSSLVEGVLRMLALALFRSSLACSRLQKRWRVKAPALVVAVAVVIACIAYPLGLAASGHICRYVQHLFSQFLISQAIRGIPLAIAATTLQYLLLKAFGKAAGSLEPAEFDEMSELHS